MEISWMWCFIPLVIFFSEILHEPSVASTPRRRSANGHDTVDDMIGFKKIMEGPTSSKYFSAGNRERLWTNNIIYYTIDTNFSPHYASDITWAMAQISSNSCIKFKRTEKPGRMTLYIEKSEEVCQATVGSVPDPDRVEKVLHVDLDERECSRGVIVHELMHSAGLYHEHQRSDRDHYVTVHYENVLEKAQENFKPAKDLNVFTPYDYGSIMHYGEKDFQKVKNSDLITLTSKKPLGNIQLGQRDRLTAYDIVKLNRLYECNEQNKACKDARSDCHDLSMNERYCETKSPVEVKTNCMKTCGLCRLIRKRKRRGRKNK